MQQLIAATGHVTFNEQLASARFHRFVEEKMRDRMRDLTDEEAGSAEYEVAFFDEDALGEVSCLVVVQRGDQLWRSWETAGNPRLALNRSLERLCADARH